MTMEPPASPSVGPRLRSERGASAVEFALVVPVLLLLLLGVVDVTRALQVQSTLTAAAREGARVMSLTNDPAKAQAAVRAVASTVSLTDGQISVTPTNCLNQRAGAMVTVTVHYHQPYVTGALGDAGLDLTGSAGMRCGG